MARVLVSVEVDPSGEPSAPRSAVELRLVWGKDLVAVEVVPPPRKADAVLRGADLRSAEMQACFEEVTLARATAEGSWELVLPDGSAAPAGTRLASRTGKAVLRASLVTPEELDLPRERSDGRVRRAVLGATVLHLAIVAFALSFGGGRPAAPAAYTPPLLAPLLAEAAGEALPEGEASPVTTTAVTAPSRSSERETSAAPGDAPPARFGMVGLAAGGARAPGRAARAFQAYEPEPAALAMFTPSIDEGVSAAGLALGAP